MTNRERVLAALRHEQPDKTPFCVGFTQKARAAMAAYLDDPRFGEGIDNCFTVAQTAPADAWREIEPDLWEDQFGVRWDRSVDKDIGVVVNQLVASDTIDGFAFPDPSDASRYESLPLSEAEKGDRFVVAEIGFSLFERAWTLAGMENLLMAMVCDPPFVHRLLDRILEFNLAIIARACDRAVDAMYFGDDWGSQRGLLMGRDLWRAFIEPRVRAMYQAVKARGRHVVIHSCGKVDELFPTLIDVGIDVFNPFQPEVIDVYEAKRVYGDRLCFFGGISTQRLLPYGTPAEVRVEVSRLLERVGEKGGYFAAPAHAIPPDARPENIAAMLDVLHNQ